MADHWGFPGSSSSPRVSPKPKPHPIAPLDGHRTYSPPFKNYSYRTREDVQNDNDSDEEYNTDEERKKWQSEELKLEFPECYTPVPRGIPETCFACKAPVVVRIQDGRKILDCETKATGFTRHYKRWWDEAIVEELKDRKDEIRNLEARINVLEKVSIS